MLKPSQELHEKKEICDHPSKVPKWDRQRPTKIIRSTLLMSTLDSSTASKAEQAASKVTASGWWVPPNQAFFMELRGDGRSLTRPEWLISEISRNYVMIWSTDLIKGCSFNELSLSWDSQGVEQVQHLHPFSSGWQHVHHCVVTNDVPIRITACNRIPVLQKWIEGLKQ